MKCPLCQPALSREEGWELWKRGPGRKGAFYASTTIGQPVSEEQVRLHLYSHRVEQPPYVSKPRAICLDTVEKISDREKALLRFVARFPAADAETLAMLFYDSGNKNASLKTTSRAVRKLMEKDILYRLYLHSLPGPGPRPKPDPSPLYFVGGTAKAWIAENTGTKVTKGEWCGGRDDWADWQKPWDLWKKTNALLFLLRALPESQPQIRSLENISVHAEDIWPGKIVPGILHDQLLGTFRWRPDAIALASEGGRKVPLLLWTDNPATSSRKTIESVLKAGGVGRSGVLQELNRRAEMPLVVVWTKGDKRAEELARAGTGVISGKQNAIAADFSTAAARPQGKIWRDLKSGEMISLEEAVCRKET